MTGFKTSMPWKGIIRVIFLWRARKSESWVILRFIQDMNKRRRIFFLFLDLSAVPKKSTPRKFAYIWHF